MRAGYLRFQAQYLRRIRVPNRTDVPPTLRPELAESAEKKDELARHRAIFALYGLSKEEQPTLEGEEN